MHVSQLAQGHVDVRCPRCGARALVRPSAPPDRRRLGVPRRLSCGACGLVRDDLGRVSRYGDADGRDPWFAAALWFRADTRLGVVWAYHREHLADLRAYVAAVNRPQHRPQDWRSVLPRWMIDAHHRDQVVTVIDRLLDAEVRTDR